MANRDDEVKGEELLKRGFDWFFNRLGETIHGAATKDTKKEELEEKGSEKASNGATSQDGTAPPKEIETQGEEVKRA